MTPRPEVEKSWRPVDVWLDILEAFDSDDMANAIAAREEFEDKYLVRGQLLVTPEQFDELCRIRQAQEIEDLHHQKTWLEAVGANSSRPPRLSDIPVKLVTEAPTDIGGGLKAIYAHGSIYVYREVDWEAKVQLGVTPEWLKGLLS